MDRIDWQHFIATTLMQHSSTLVDESSSKQRNGRRYVAFEIEHEGHYAGYILNLARYWAEHQLAGKFEIVVTQRFIDLHTDVVAEVNRLHESGVRIVGMTSSETTELEAKGRFRYFKAWQLYCKYAKVLRADHGLIMYFDFFQLPSILGKSPCPFSCIYFRPTFHYHSFSNYVGTFAERFKAFRKKAVLQRVLAKKELRNLFCLDPFACEFIRDRMNPSVQVVYLPDPVKVYSDSGSRSAQLRKTLGVPADRVVFLLLGVLDRRKGVMQLLEAIDRLPGEVASKCAFVLAGPVEAAQREAVLNRVDRLNDNPDSRVILRNEFIPDREVQEFYGMADVVLATYQKHMGMSSALVRAAAAGKPVLASNYGLTSELTQRRKLGITVDSTDPQAIANSMGYMVGCDPQSLFDGDEARRFAAENSAENTANTLFDALFHSVAV